MACSVDGVGVCAAARRLGFESGRRPARALLLLVPRHSPFGPACGCSRLQAALVFACPKKRRQKKGHPYDLPFASLRVPCALRPKPALRNCFGAGAPHPTGAASGDNRARHGLSRSPIAQTVLASPGFVLQCSAAPKGIRALRSQQRGVMPSCGGELNPLVATSSRRATQHPAGESECRSEATHERGGMRDKPALLVWTAEAARRVRSAATNQPQGSHRSAVTGLLEQMLLPPFGETKGGRVRAAARIENKSARSAQQIQA